MLEQLEILIDLKITNKDDMNLFFIFEIVKAADEIEHSEDEIDANTNSTQSTQVSLENLGTTLWSDDKSTQNSVRSSEGSETSSRGSIVTQKKRKSIAIAGNKLKSKKVQPEFGYTTIAGANKKRVLSVEENIIIISESPIINHVTHYDLCSYHALKSNQKITTTCVDYFANKMYVKQWCKHYSAKIVYIPTTVYNKINSGTPGYQINDVQNYFRNEIKFFQYDYIFIPIFLDDHFSLVCLISLGKNDCCMIMIDSANMHNSKNYKDNICKNLRA